MTGPAQGAVPARLAPVESPLAQRTTRTPQPKLKQDLREGRVRLEHILATGTDYLASAEVFDLLVAVPKIGPVNADHLLTIARISPSKTVGALSGRQRTRLIELLSG
jgi:hypothetical protein